MVWQKLQRVRTAATGCTLIKYGCLQKLLFYIQDKLLPDASLAHMSCTPYLFLWSGSRDPLGSATAMAATAEAPLLSACCCCCCRRLVLVLLSISASPSSLSVSEALFCTKHTTICLMNSSCCQNLSVSKAVSAHDHCSMQRLLCQSYLSSGVSVQKEGIAHGYRAQEAAGDGVLDLVGGLRHLLGLDVGGLAGVQLAALHPSNSAS